MHPPQGSVVVSVEQAGTHLLRDNQQRLGRSFQHPVPTILQQIIVRVEIVLSSAAAQRLIPHSGLSTVILRLTAFGDAAQDPQFFVCFLRLAKLLHGLGNQGATPSHEKTISLFFEARFLLDADTGNHVPGIGSVFRVEPLPRDPFATRLGNQVLRVGHRGSATSLALRPLIDSYCPRGSRDGRFHGDSAPQKVLRFTLKEFRRGTIILLPQPSSQDAAEDATFEKATEAQTGPALRNAFPDRSFDISPETPLGRTSQVKPGDPTTPHPRSLIVVLESMLQRPPKTPRQLGVKLK
jgi:hypothetical protein